MTLAKYLGDTYPLPRPALTVWPEGQDLLKTHCVPGQTPARGTATGTHHVSYPKGDEFQVFQLLLEYYILPHASMAVSLESLETTGKSR